MGLGKYFGATAIQSSEVGGTNPPVAMAVPVGVFGWIFVVLLAGFLAWYLYARRH